MQPCSARINTKNKVLLAWSFYICEAVCKFLFLKKKLSCFAAIVALAFFFSFIALLSGAASGVGSGHGSEDEHPAQQQSQHAQGGAAHEPTRAPKHPQVAKPR